MKLTKKIQKMKALRMALEGNMLFKDKMFYVEEPRLCSHKRILNNKGPKAYSSVKKGR